MKIIALAAQKGGSGKTTLAAHLAVQAHLESAHLESAQLGSAHRKPGVAEPGCGELGQSEPGPSESGQSDSGQYDSGQSESGPGEAPPGEGGGAEAGGPIALIDTDPQGSLTAWYQEREEKAPIFAQALMARLDEQLAELEKAGVRFTFIDTPPAITSTIGHVIKHADLVLIPTRPSPHDLRAAGVTVDIAEGLGKPLIFVINGAHPRARITTQAALALSQHGPVAPAVIHQRTDYSSSMIDGRTVMELPRHSRSPEEIEQLWLYVKDRAYSSARTGQGVAGSSHMVGLGELQRIA